MDNAFNSPVQVLDANMKAGVGKAKLPLLKCILLGLMAGGIYRIWRRVEQCRST